MVIIEQLRLAEKAAEDIYFAKIDRELIESLHKRLEAEKSFGQPFIHSTLKRGRKLVRRSESDPR